MQWSRLTPPVVRTLNPAWRRWGAAAFAALALLGLGTRANAQGTTGTITGEVTDAATKSPIVGAAVRITGTQLGAQTGNDGKYTIRGVRVGSVTLQVNRIGYTAKTVTVTVAAGRTATANAEISEAAFSLATVVTTVTGVQSKAEISNTVATVDVGSKVAEAPIVTASEVLSGRASGVQVLESGDVGSGSRIRIRGTSSLSLNNDPIVYVDGVRVDGSTGNNAIGTGGSGTGALDNISPEEIESIDVIKGPAAATLYGTQAANGVILITTKKGKQGTTRFSAFAEQGTEYDSHKGNYPDLWVSFDNVKGAAAGKPVTCSLVQEANGSCTIDSTFHHNILNDPITTPLSAGPRSMYGGQLSGGAEHLQYFVSGDVNHEQGPYKMPANEISRLTAERGTTVGDDQIYPNALKQVNFRTNLNSQLGTKADVGVSVGYADVYTRLAQNNDNSDGLMVDALGGSARTDLVDSRGIPLLGDRSFPMGDIFAQRYARQINRYISGLTGHWYPLSWLTSHANIGYDYTSAQDKFIQEFNQGPYGETNRNGFIQDIRGETDIYTVDLGATATGTFHGFTAKTSGGAQYFRNFFAQTSASGQGLPPGATQATAGAIQSASQRQTESINLGGYGEEVLSYKERIFLTGGLRYDGNSAFGSNFKGVFYPKVGLSWLLSDESFFPKINALNSFRLRATYGASGVQPGTTDALRFYSAGANTIVGTAETPGVTLGALGNTNLKPEYSGEFEGGMDLTAFENKTSVELTYYHKKTKDALIAAPTAPSLGGSISTLLENIGSTQNTGLELTLNQKFIDNSQVGFEMQFNGSINNNKILQLGQGIPPIFTGNRSTQKNTPGYPLFALFGQGYTYNDANHDGLLTPSEVHINSDTSFFGPTTPTHEFGLSPRLELFHRKLAISTQFDHKDGDTKFYNTLRHRCQGGQSCPGLWDPNASLADQAAAIADNNYSDYTGYFYNGEFTRWRELSVSYELPERLAQKIHASRASLVGTGRNLAVWTAYPGIDPEATVGNSDARGNEEYFSTPPLRSFTLRLNLGF